MRDRNSEKDPETGIRWAALAARRREAAAIPLLPSDPLLLRARDVWTRPVPSAFVA